MKNNRVSFLIPTLGERERELKRLLESLKEQTANEGIVGDSQMISDCVEAVIIAQGNYENIRQVAESYKEYYKVILIESEVKGLSKARNRGLKACTGEIVVLSDDDCWYASNAVGFYRKEFTDTDVSVLFTQIKDYEKDALYKKYSENSEFITSKWKLLSRSSIEIAFRKADVNVFFDENFGRGAKFVAGEENDFLLNVCKTGVKMKYIPEVTVYHPKKEQENSAKSNEARGAFYAKHFNGVVGFAICLRDLVFRRQNIFGDFWDGYREYRKMIKRNRQEG